LLVVSVLARLRNGWPEGSEGVGVASIGVADIAFLLKFIGPFPDHLRAGVFIGEAVE
jgi:hypothetical protein